MPDVCVCHLFDHVLLSCPERNSFIRLMISGIFDVVFLIYSDISTATKTDTAINITADSITPAFSNGGTELLTDMDKKPFFFDVIQ